MWADAAKGVCITLVVLWHVTQKHYLEITWRTSMPIPGAWGTLVEAMQPLRMPLFFLLSGVFAANAVNRPWSAVRRPRVVRYYYLFLCWVLIHTALLSLTPDFDTAGARNGLELLEQLTISPPNLWYLYALALYFTIAKLLRRVSPAAVLACSFMLSAVAAAEVLPTPGNQGSLYQNLFFFLAGIHFRPFVERLARESSPRRLALTGSAYLVALLAMVATAAQQWPLVWPLVGVVAVIFGVTAAGQAERWPVLGRAAAAVGRQTLPIYVIHMPLLALLDWLLREPVSDIGSPWQWWYAVVEPAALTALIAASCLLLDAGLRKIGATWLFDLPGRDRRAARDGDGTAAPPYPPRTVDAAVDAPTVRLPVVDAATVRPPAARGDAPRRPAVGD